MNPQAMYLRYRGNFSLLGQNSPREISKILGQDAALARTLTDAYTPAGSAKSPTRTT
jgi:hypothetical protein